MTTSEIDTRFNNPSTALPALRYAHQFPNTCRSESLCALQTCSQRSHASGSRMQSSMEASTHLEVRSGRARGRADEYYSLSTGECGPEQSLVGRLQRDAH